MANIKKSFPIASVLFILYVIANMVTQVINVINSISVIAETGSAAGNYIVSSIVTVITAVIGLIPYILLAIFALNTAKKPSIPYIVVLAITTVVSLVAIPASLVSLTTALTNEYVTSNYKNSTIFLFIAGIFFVVTLVAVLLYAILVKASKKPSKLSSLWFVFCAPGCLYVVTFVIGKIFGYLNSSELFQMMPDVHSKASVISTLIYIIPPILVVAAFFLVSMQFAKASKIPAVEEAPEITE